MSSATDPDPEREALVREKKRTLAEGRKALRRYKRASDALYAYDDSRYTNDATTRRRSEEEHAVPPVVPSTSKEK